MALDPTLDTYALVVVAAAGAVAAGMHATALAGSGKPWPARRVLIANLISTALVGMAVGEAARHVPIKADLIPVLLIAAITGHTLGPRGVGWLFAALLGGLQKLPWVPKLPPIPDTESPALTPQEEPADA
ncbi:hypothetical protein [Deinococcus aquaticus]|uniref:hypothetical protein n=1 Tax=Deinococcus aquaticus TaxID=328692 RepID=UPI003F463FD7